MTAYIFTSQNYNGVTQMHLEDYFDVVELENLYQWVDRIPLTRPKKNIGKDFSDAVLVAEIIKHYFPRLIDVHNYPPAVGPKQKMENWFLLNRKVLHRLELDLSEDVIRALVNGKQSVVEKVLMMLRVQIDKFIERFNAMKARTFQLRRCHGKNGIEEDIFGGSQPSSTHHDNDGKSMMSSRSRPGNIPFGNSNRITSKPVFTAPVTDNVPITLLEDKKLECKAKDETVQILNVKILKMEQLLQLKEDRIQDLERRLKLL
ncbi:unnamed protein product [Lymnaea stagnalis]|uniref:Calponin-homology (CH) domain-containing protein n=1 Tax=Lymnaea stagnalis TaxID=6523 RepID=A0AAV2I7V1_LYMST